MTVQGTAWWGLCPHCRLSFGTHLVDCPESGVLRVNAAAAMPPLASSPLVLSSAAANPLPQTIYYLNTAGGQR